MNPVISYAAFLRGINVGGHKVIKMNDLVHVFALAGMKNVRTLIASGNVVFDSSTNDANVLARKIEKNLLKTFGFEIPVCVMKINDLRAMVKRNPFKQVALSEEAVPFVTFFSSEPNQKVSLPLESSKEGLEVLSVRDGVAFVVARRKSDGRFGFPNNFIEKTFGAHATTRNWNTVQRMAAVKR